MTAGTGSIQQAGGATTVTQTSGNLSLSWQSFNTSAAETVTYIQPSASAIAVNRILEANPTQFLGRLNANGQVYLINPNGMLFGGSAQINVGGLVASTLDMNDADLLGATRTFSGNGAGRIVNQGSITAAAGGYVAFVGTAVSNQGSIAAPRGTVALGAGGDVTLAFAGDSLVKLQINRSTLDTLAENGGMIRADGGAVMLSAGAKDAVLASVVNNSGIVQARSVQDVNGTIVLEGGARSQVLNSGTLGASGNAAGQTGGTVKMLGDQVTLAATGTIDVSGAAGGGTALVGGNFKGAGPERNATTTAIAAGSTITANAGDHGKGGQVAIWSNGDTSFNGTVSARGGAAAGDGGTVETSGSHLTVGAAGSVDTRAPNGTVGGWLLDPVDLVIGDARFVAGDIDDQQITDALNISNVTIATSAAAASCAGTSCPAGRSGAGDIILLDQVTIGSGTDNGRYWTSNTTLTLSAYRNIEFQGLASIDAAAGGTNSNIVLRADNSGTGVGTIITTSDSSVFSSANGSISLYYNPSSYATPTDFAGSRDNGGNLTFRVNNNSQLQAYMLVNLAATIGNKTYDGGTTATINSIAVRGGAPSDATVDTSGATAAFADKNVGSAKAVTVTGVTLGGSGASKYALNGLDGGTANITKLDLNLSGITAGSKQYNATTAATLSGTAVVAQIVGDVVNVAGSGAGTFADKNVGVGKAVAVSGYTLTGADAGNYNLIVPTNLTADIVKADLNVTGITANSRNYDSTTNASLSGTAVVSALGSDVVSVTGTGSATFADKNAGSAKAVTVTGYSLGGADAGNYNVVQPSGLTATINKADVSVTGLSATSRAYDATTGAALSGTATVTGFAGDDLSVTGSGSGAFADKNVGTAKAVTVSGYSLAGADAGNYNLVPSTGLTADITRFDLALSGITANNRDYNGTAAATMSGSAVVSQLGSDVVSVTGSGAGSAFADKNAGMGKAVAVAGYSLSGADAGNYNLVVPTNLTADIAKANLSVTGVSANNRTYDGTVNATLSGTAVVTAFGGDVVNVTGPDSATFSDKNAAIAKAVTVTGYGLSGADAGNYNVVQPTGLTATIGKASLNLTGVAVADKVYDGTTAATLAGTAAVAGIAGDDVNVTGSGSAVFADKNAGANKAVFVSGYTLSGLDAGNYTLAPSGGLTATITKFGLDLSGIAADNRTYDGTTAATISGSGVVSALGSDVVSVVGSGAGSAFADKSAGTGKAVTVAGYSLTGADAGNYILRIPTNLTADIAKAVLNVTGVSVANKTYDSTVNATLSGTAVVSALGSDVVTVTGTGSALFTDKNAGSGKSAVVSGYALGGADAGNYVVVQPTGLSATINKVDIAVTGVSATDKVYDSYQNAGLIGTATITGIAGDDVSVTGTGSGFFADKNVGTGKAVTIVGFTLGGTDAGNYNLVPSTTHASITPLGLALSGIAAVNKTYDGTTAATMSGSANVAGLGVDDVGVAGSGAGSTFADKNAGIGKAVTVAGYTLTGVDAGNYSLVMPTGRTADIAKASLNVTGVTAGNRTYDGTTSATLAGTAVVAAFGSDVVNVTATGSATFADKNVGTAKAVTVTGYGLSGTDAGNYIIVQPTGLTANITTAALSVSGLSVANKTYDGTTAAVLGGTANVAVIGSDMVSVAGSGTASFADKNAGTAKAVTITGYTLSGADAGNYTLTQPAGVTATIAKADLALGGISATDKTYDGTTAGSLSGPASVTPIGSDVVSIAGSGTSTFADKNAGTHKAVTVSGYTLTGADAGNYSLVTPGLAADIARADLAVGGVAANAKTYDGTTAATLSGSAAVSAFGNDVVTVNGTGSAVFADKNAGVGKAVAVSGYTLAGADAANYAIVQPVGISATITLAIITVNGITAAAKTYDATTAVTLTGTASVAGFGSDDVAVTGTGTGAFADRNAGTNKAVTVTGYTLTGADAGNYTLTQPTGITATINRAGLNLSGITAAGKTYDGSTAATLSGTASVSAFGGDIVIVGGAGMGTFADKNAGVARTVAVSGYTLAGADAGNYLLLPTTGLTADIARAALAVTGVTATSRTYDGTTSATLSGIAAVNAFSGDVVAVGGTGIGAFANKNVGTAKAVAVSGYTLTGADAANYTVVQPGTLVADITPARLTVSGVSALDKTYDAATTAALAGTATINAIGGDDVRLGGAASGVFADRNAGTNTAVSVSGYTLTGADAGNYAIVQPAGLTASISRASLAVSGLRATGKTYDGTTTASLSGVANVSAFGGDAVTVAGSGTATFADRNAGTGKAVSVTGYSLTGADAGNYTIVQPSGLRADITRATLTIGGITAADKVFDGATDATVSTAGATFSGRIGTDAIAVASTGAFSDPAVGTGKVVTLGNVYGGADLVNYTVVDQAMTTASITAAPVVTAPAAPVIANTPAIPAVASTQVQRAVTQVQSTLLPVQVATSPQALAASTTIDVTGADGETRTDTRGSEPNRFVDQSIGVGPGAPSLRIQNGGMNLPAAATTISE